jgi:hypothetical protein
MTLLPDLVEYDETEGAEAAVTAFKMDLLTSDLICLEIESEDGTSFLVNEDMEGFSDLCKVLNKILPNIREAWYQAVGLPPFKPNKLVVWQK